MEPHTANSIAVGGQAKAVRDALKRLGMRRCSLRLVYYQCEPSDGLRLDWYSLYWRWLEAVWMVNPPGAQFLLDDLLVRFARLREAETAVGEGRSSCWREQMVRCETEHSDVVKAALVSDLGRIRREATECIAAKRQLIVAIDAELARGARAA